MEPKGIIISQKDYERLTDIEKNFDKKVEETKEKFKKGLEDAIKGNLVKILWVNDKSYAEIMGCDLSDDGICSFISREDADFADGLSSNKSYDPGKLIKKNGAKVQKEQSSTKKAIGLYREIIETQKRTIRNLWWAFGIMFVAWLLQLIAYIMK